ncbi:ROK family protein [Photobacterium minamisatsumaniensis]|uniref:ROK family protein n=1 Tax=Photobacterium minamisatsumaniensis TaxID=2910233 RepID=UPI003D117D5B
MLIGLDIGGTKIEGVSLDPASFELLEKFRTPTPKEGYSAFLDAVITTIDRLCEEAQPLSIGIGCCGSINKNSGKMQGSNLLYLNGQDFIGDLKKHYALPIAVANDADCLAISEFKSGAAKGADNSCIAVIIGTGCGSGVIINGDIVTGLNNLGGEMGHNPLPGYQTDTDGENTTCYCGSVNCIESFCSGTGFERTFANKFSPLKAKAIFDLAADNDANALAHIDLYCDQLARSLASIINVIDPEIIVLGGGMSNQESIYPRVQDKLNQYTFSKTVKTQVVKAVHGDSSGVRGAAILPALKGLVS